METNFNFKSQVCTSVVQSRRLLELGLKKETADCYWTKPFGDWIVIVGEGNIDENNIPAWSLHRLAEMLAFKWGEIILFLPDAYDEVISDIEIEIVRGNFNKEYLV